MHKTILQVPVSKQLKNDAEKAAIAQGFSSLQEIVRVFLSKLAEEKIKVSIQESLPLSEKSEKRYQSITKDFENQKNIYVVNDAKQLIKKLNEDSLS